MPNWVGDDFIDHIIHVYCWGQHTLVPTDLKKVWIILPRSCNAEYLIFLTLKCQLTDKSIVSKQLIEPALVNRAVELLTNINPFYNNVSTDNQWEDWIGVVVMETFDQQEWQRA